MNPTNARIQKTHYSESGRRLPSLLVIAFFGILSSAALAQPAGKGLFIELSDGRELLDIDDVNGIPGLGRPNGVQLHVKWRKFQPNSGTPDFTDLGIWLDAVASASGAPLRAILRVDMIGGGTAGVGDPVNDSQLSTPPWAYSTIDHIGGVELTDPSIVYPLGSTGHFVPYLPWYGDPNYQALVESFATYLRDFLLGQGAYLGQPDRSGLIEFVRLGGWQANSNEPNFYFDYTDSDYNSYPAFRSAVKKQLSGHRRAAG